MLFSSAAILALSSIVVASPLSTRNPASSALHALSKRNPWNLDPALSSDLQAAFTTGLKDAISIAAAVLDPTNGIDNRDKNNQYMIAYFGQEDETTYDKVRSVFQNLVGTNSDGTGSNIPATVTVYDEDWVIPGPGKGPGGGGDGTKRLCDLSSNGLTLTAYTATRRDKGTKWGMHFCPKWTARVTAKYSLSRITADSCAALQDTSVMDTTLMNRQNYAFGILHEFFHVREVAWDVTGKTTGDFAYGAWNVLELALGHISKPNGGVAEPLENADTFAWYALVSPFYPSPSLSQPMPKRRKINVWQRGVATLANVDSISTSTPTAAARHSTRPPASTTASVPTGILRVIRPNTRAMTRIFSTDRASSARG